VSEKTLKQTIYDHGGSRIYLVDDKNQRDLIADTYYTEEYALAMMEFTKHWFATKKNVKKGGQ